MNLKLLNEALIKYLLGLLFVFILLFLPCYSLDYFNGWLFIVLLFIPMFIGGIIMFFKRPELLKSRLNAKEKIKSQKIVVMISGIMFISGFVIASLNFKYKLLPFIW